MSEALNEAIREEMQRDPGVFVIGEDIGMHGGLFGVTEACWPLRPPAGHRLPDLRGRHRRPGLGGALVGCRPIVELQIFDFVTLTMDQLANHAAKWRYMSGGQVSVPWSCAARSPTASAWPPNTPRASKPGSCTPPA